MWIFAKSGFFSVVEDSADPSMVFVRARQRKDLAALKLGKIIVTPKADYGFRCHVSKIVWARRMLDLCLAIDYPNFKNTVPARKVLYGEVWHTMRELQDGVAREPEASMNFHETKRKGVKFFGPRLAVRTPR